MNSVALKPISQQQAKQGIKCMNKLCQSDCICAQIQYGFTPHDCNQIIHRGIIANNPNNPGFNLKQGVISYNKIQTIPLSQVCKIKLCFRNNFMLINTLQIYLNSNQSHPVCMGVSRDEASLWIYRAIEAKLVTKHHINIISKNNTHQTICGFIFKKSLFGKWVKLQATCSTITPPYLKIEDQLFNTNSTSQIWSRLEMIKQQGMDCLIIKLWGPFGKNQLAIPLCQLRLWLQSICSLLN